MLRCLEIRHVIRDLDLLTVGMVLDLWTEKANDTVAVFMDNNSILIAGQEQFDNF